MPPNIYLWKLQLVGFHAFQLPVGAFERSLLLGRRIPCRPIARLSFCYLLEISLTLHLLLLKLQLGEWESASAPITFQDISSDDPMVINLELLECNIS